MVKTTVYLPDDLKGDVADAARKRGVTEAEFIRLALQRAVEQQRTWRRPRTGIIASRRGRATSNLSERVDEILAEGFGRD